MSTFDHPGLMQDINECLVPFRKSQPDAMKGFGQLAQAAMAGAHADINGHYITVERGDYAGDGYLETEALRERQDREDKAMEEVRRHRLRLRLHLRLHLRLRLRCCR